MKTTIVRIISASLIFSTVIGLASCKKNVVEPENNHTEFQTKSVTSEIKKIIDVPTEKADIVKMFNAALEYVEVYCRYYTKKVKCTANSVNVGSLSKVSNSADALRLIFGQRDTIADFEYSEAKKDLFDSNFIKSGFTVDSVGLTSAKKDDNKIIITVEMPNEFNPSAEKIGLEKYGGELIDAEKIKNSLDDFSSSANTTNISVSGIKMTAKINADDSRLEELTIKFNEDITLSGVKMVELDGDSVSGKTTTEIKYIEIS